MNITAYPQYKESYISWLGDIPEHWKVKKLKWIARLKYGSSLSSENRIVGEVPVYGSNGIVGYHDESITESPCIIVGRKGSFGKINLSSIKCFPIDTTYYIDSMSTQNNLFWLNYVLPLLGLDISSKDSAVPGLSRDEAYMYLVAEPPKDEQQTIAAFLDYKTEQIDKLIDKKEQLLKLLEEKRIALITQAVTKGLDSTVKMKPSGVDWLGDIPKHWGLKQLKRAAQITYGIGGEIDKEVTEGVRLLSLPNVTFEGDIKLDDEFYIELNESEKKEYLLKKGDLLFNWRNGSSNHLAKTAIIDFEGEFTHVSFLLRLRFYVRNESRYFRYLINSLRATGFFSSSKAGVNNTFNLTELSNLFLMIPPHEEQIEISNFLDGKLKKMVSIQIVIEEAIDRLKEYRTSLITSAVTGKIDVRDFKPERV